MFEDDFEDEFGRAGRPAAGRAASRAMGGAMRGGASSRARPGRGGAIPPRLRPPLRPPMRQGAMPSSDASSSGFYDTSSEGFYDTSSEGAAGYYDASSEGVALDFDGIGAQVADELIGAAPPVYGAVVPSPMRPAPMPRPVPRYGQEAPAKCACNTPITAVACFPNEERAPSMTFVDAMKIGAGVALGVSAVALGIQVLRRI